MRAYASEKKKCPLPGRMFFSSPARSTATNVIMASRSQMVTDVSNWRGDMKLYFHVSRTMREGQFPFSLLPIRSARFAVARLTLLLSLIFAVSSPVLSQQPSKQNSLESVPTAEFARIVREFSEDGGYFMSDNFTSNETSYLHIIDKLRELGVTGGAYIGVGPEQNFTYRS